MLSKRRGLRISKQKGPPLPRGSPAEIVGVLLDSYFQQLAALLNG
jgi:hypothetical protein